MAREGIKEQEKKASKFQSTVHEMTAQQICSF